jgi:hypothetical protein
MSKLIAGTTCHRSRKSYLSGCSILSMCHAYMSPYTGTKVPHFYVFFPKELKHKIHVVTVRVARVSARYVQRLKNIRLVYNRSGSKEMYEQIEAPHWRLTIKLTNGQGWVVLVEPYINY